ncbi:hypothetical protein PTTG_06065 [Puccinia triticina 1-1 BBBD Race 1]|uniref:AB hydrolase-1 domain-containing protein n=1 Tax=Puccinia triticina (isolate 1-1 / race 1 (BBBD)) TaxID=630390 RepID=A0A0C4EZ10_PUCT1|nr:hypothetical protein PTTG_06065 [Puccinia triticina 1-1 BBBD Race 1]WAR63968.1 hypothetical protein PtB15_16B127 [Puccinia triticina]
MICQKSQSAASHPAMAPFIRNTFSIPAGVEGAERLVMWSYIPKDLAYSDGASPVIIMANGLALPRSAGLPHIAARFATAGYTVLLFDFRHLGDSTGQPRQLVSSVTQLEDYITVLRFVTDPDTHAQFLSRKIPSSKVVLWGWSNSGGHVAKLATQADKLPISAVIALDPLCDGRTNFLHHVRNYPLGLARIGHWVLGDFLLSIFPVLNKHTSLRVPAFGRGGILSSEEAEEGFRMLNSDVRENEGATHELGNCGFGKGPKLINEIAARYGFEVLSQRCNGTEVKCPILVSWAQDDGDSLITSKIPRRFAEDCLKAENSRVSVDIHEHKGDHFGLHFGGAGFEAGIEKQLQFLQSVFGSSQSETKESKLNN